jgi:hypothetical protein
MSRRVAQATAEMIVAFLTRTPMSNPEPAVCHCPKCGQAHYTGFGPDEIAPLRTEIAHLKAKNNHLRTLLHSAVAHVRSENDDTLETLINNALKDRT